VQCRKAVITGKEHKLHDALGLYLLITASGAKSWRLRYQFAGREKKLTFGLYPAVPLARARQLRDEARALLAVGTDPSVERKRQRATAIAESLETFRQVALAWHKQRAKTLNARYATQILDRLTENVFPSIGGLPVRQISAPMVLALIRSIEARGAREMAHRVRLHISDVFVFAIASGIAETDPAALIRKALERTDPQLRPAMVRLVDVRAVLPATEALPDVYWATLLASRLCALTAARPGVVRLAERSEFEDLDGAMPVWRIPAAKMKLTRARKLDATYEFIVPLSRQAVSTVMTAMAASPSATWIFPGIGDQQALPAGEAARSPCAPWLARELLDSYERARRDRRPNGRSRGDRPDAGAYAGWHRADLQPPHIYAPAPGNRPGMGRSDHGGVAATGRLVAGNPALLTRSGCRS